MIVLNSIVVSSPSVGAEYFSLWGYFQHFSTLHKIAYPLFAFYQEIHIALIRAYKFVSQAGQDDIIEIPTTRCSRL